jgi:hypothetical protein
LERSVPVLMRDGVPLSTDVYLPLGTERFPVILIRTPYDKRHYRPEASTAESERSRQTSRYFSSHGYAVVIQDMRGKWESGGGFSIYSNEREDFEDTLNWLAAQPWSAQRVGTWGCSSLGETQIVTAPVRHPSFRAMAPEAAAGGIGSAAGRYRYFGVLYGGAFELVSALGWFAANGSASNLRPPPGMTAEQWSKLSPLYSLGPRAPPGFDYNVAVRSLPIVGLLDRSGFPPTDWNDMVSSPPGARYWTNRPYLREGENISVPALHADSWYDYGVGDTIAEYQYFKSHADNIVAAKNQYLIIGAGLHCTNRWAGSHMIVGERDVGDPQFDHWAVYLAWFDRWLKDDTTALRGVPHVHYYLLGKNEWRSADTMPIPGTRERALFLASERGANSIWGDGELANEPSRKSSIDTWTYDPSNPVPSLGGPICCTSGFDQPAGSYDQRPVEARQDVLVYSTPRLRSGVTAVGPVKAILYVSSTAKDTDFTAKLVDVYPDGRAFYLVEGILRARYRDSQERSVLMNAGDVYRLEIDLQAIGNWFGPGHQIRLEVSSSSFPRWDRNLNTGGNNYDESVGFVAQNTIHVGRQTPSRLILPVVGSE